jgi:hypothetical protein
VPDVERKGATMPHTSVNGNMFNYLDAWGSIWRCAYLHRWLCAAFESSQHEQVVFCDVAAPLDTSPARCATPLLAVPSR